MKARTKILFKINNVVVVEESSDTLEDTVDKMREIIAEECECDIDEVSVEYETFPDISEYDISVDGMACWTDLVFKYVQGVRLNLEVGSDSYLDAVNNGTLEKYLEFIS